MDKLKVMVKYNLVKGLPKLSNFGREEICEGFQYRKAHRLPFDRSLSRCNTPLELIHSDLMGSTRTPSFAGYFSMVIFIDDFTRFTWIYFVKQKSEVLKKFMKFKETIECELGSTIRRLQTDNGGEFTSEEFLSFCHKH